MTTCMWYIIKCETGTLPGNISKMKESIITFQLYIDMLYRQIGNILDQSMYKGYF